MILGIKVEVFRDFKFSVNVLKMSSMFLPDELGGVGDER